MKRLLLAILLPLLLMSPALAVDPIRDQMAALDIDSVEDAVPQDARTLLGDLSVDVGTDYNGAFTRMLRNAWPRLVPWIREGFSLVLRTVASIGLAGVVYVILVLVLKIITRDDCRLLPKGDKIAKFLRIS